MKHLLPVLFLLTTSAPLLAQFIKTARMPLNDSLKTDAKAYSVRQKFSLSQGKANMHFGPYLAQVQFDLIRIKSRSSRLGSHGGTMTTTYSKQRDPMHFSFQLADSARNFNANTTCTTEFDREANGQLTYNWIRTFLGSIPEANHIFAGSMLIRRDTISADPADEPNWNFIIYNTSSGIVNDSAKAVVGLISNDDQSTQIRINIVSGVNISMPAWVGMNDLITGYEFRYNNQLIGAVETLMHGTAKGHVWLKNDLLNDLKFVVANVAEAILVQNEMGFLP